MKYKNSFIGIFFTVLVIGLLILSGPASAIDVSLTTPPVDVSKDSTEEFTIDITVNDGEFLPLLYTDLIFTNELNNEISCKIDDKNQVSGCSFIYKVSRTVSNLNGGYGYGYGYGYDSNNNLGYDNFGYGYGYGPASGSGTITYTLSVDTKKLPGSFLGKNKVVAKVYGGNENDKNYFKGSSTFEVISSEISTKVNLGDSAIITYGDISIDIPEVPVGVNSITVQQVTPTANPLTSTLKVLGKTYDFGPDG